MTNQDFSIQENSDQMPSKTNSKTAIYGGNFDEYSFAPSKKMPGFFIITDKISGRGGSDLIDKSIEKLIFHDCEKSFSQIASSLEQIYDFAVNSDTNLDVNSQQNLLESSEMNSDNLDADFEIVEQEIPFEILEEEKPFEIVENANEAQNENNILNAKFTNLVQTSSEVNSQANSDNEPIKPPSEITASENSLKITEPKGEFAFGASILPTTDTIKDLKIYIYGFNESKDNFYFDTDGCELNYKYSIAKNVFCAHFIGEINSKNARGFLNSLSFSGEKSQNHKIVVLIDDLPIFYKNNF